MAGKASAAAPQGSSSTGPSMLRLYVSGVLVGTGFGLGLQKSGVFHPDTIRDQLTLRSFTMMKMFLTATGTGLVSISAMESLGLLTRVSKSSGIGRTRILGGFEGNILGGLVLGAGMSLSGACPGTLMAQVAAGVPSALYTALGFGIGALTFGYVHAAVNRLTDFVKMGESPSLDKLLRLPVLPTALGVASVFFGIVAALEQYQPWPQGVVVVANAIPGTETLSLTAKVWSPIAAGLLVGLCQIPSYLLSGFALGASSSYISAASFVTSLLDPNQKTNAPYYQGYRGAADFYQLGIVTGILLVSLASINLSGVVYQSRADVSPLAAVLGGFLLIYGARMGGGCPSGHGLSGIGRLSIASILGAVSMFAGAFGATFLLKNL